MTIEDDLRPAVYNFTRTRGDSMTPVTFTITIDGSPADVESARAQVKATRSHTAAVVLDLEATVANGNEVTVGEGVDLDDLDAVRHYWDLEVVTPTHPSGLTPVAGNFDVVQDVTEEEGS